MCNPTDVKAAEELHARSKGYSTSVVARTLSQGAEDDATLCMEKGGVGGAVKRALGLARLVYSVIRQSLRQGNVTSVAYQL